MSAQSWKKVYYSKPADQTRKCEAIKHSLRKWLGLLPGALALHGMTVRANNSNTFSVVDKRGREAVVINGDSCSLCEHYASHPVTTCAECPLKLVRGGVRCYTPKWVGETISPWQAWIKHHNPLPMIEGLTAALGQFPE